MQMNQTQGILTAAELAQKRKSIEKQFAQYVKKKDENIKQYMSQKDSIRQSSSEEDEESVFNPTSVKSAPMRTQQAQLLQKYQNQLQKKSMIPRSIQKPEELQLEQQQIEPQLEQQIPKQLKIDSAVQTSILFDKPTQKQGEPQIEDVKDDTESQQVNQSQQIPPKTLSQNETPNSSQFQEISEDIQQPADNPFTSYCRDSSLYMISHSQMPQIGSESQGPIKPVEDQIQEEDDSEVQVSNKESSEIKELSNVNSSQHFYTMNNQKNYESVPVNTQSCQNQFEKSLEQSILSNPEFQKSKNYQESFQEFQKQSFQESYHNEQQLEDKQQYQDEDQDEYQDQYQDQYQEQDQEYQEYSREITDEKHKSQHISSQNFPDLKELNDHSDLVLGQLSQVQTYHQNSTLSPEQKSVELRFSTNLIERVSENKSEYQSSPQDSLPNESGVPLYEPPPFNAVIIEQPEENLEESDPAFRATHQSIQKKIQDELIIEDINNSRLLMSINRTKLRELILNSIIEYKANVLRTIKNVFFQYQRLSLFILEKDKQLTQTLFTQIYQNMQDQRLKNYQRMLVRKHKFQTQLTQKRKILYELKIQAEQSKKFLRKARQYLQNFRLKFQWTQWKMFVYISKANRQMDTYYRSVLYRHFFRVLHKLRRAKDVKALSFFYFNKIGKCLKGWRIAVRRKRLQRYLYKRARLRIIFMKKQFLFDKFKQFVILMQKEKQLNNPQLFTVKVKIPLLNR